MTWPEIYDAFISNLPFIAIIISITALLTSISTLILNYIRYPERKDVLIIHTSDLKEILRKILNWIDIRGPTINTIPLQIKESLENDRQKLLFEDLIGCSPVF